MTNGTPQTDPTEPAGPGAPPVAPEIGTRTLVHGLLREDGTVDGAELYAVAEALGMTDQQVRLCVKRLVADGRFTQEGRGRRSRLHAAPDAAGSLAPDVEYVRHAYRQDRGLAPWDGNWHLFAFAVPETERRARDALRDTLLYLGAAPLQGGLYVCANAIGPIVEAHADGLGVRPVLTRFTTRDLRVGEEDDPVRLAARLWPLREVAARHTALAALTQARLDRLTGPDRPTGTERLVCAVELAAAFTDAMRPDPLLPPELLPRPWPGTRARALFARCWEALAEEGDAEGPGSLRLFRLYDRTGAAGGGTARPGPDPSATRRRPED